MKYFTLDWILCQKGGNVTKDIIVSADKIDTTD